MKKITIIGLAGMAQLILVLLKNQIATDWGAATVPEIQSVTAESSCAKKILLDANREGREITRRDLNKVKGQCVSIDQQAKAF